MKPRLALLTFDFYPGVGGVQQFLFETAKRLVDDFEVVVLTPAGGKISKTTRIKKIVLPRNGVLVYWRQLQKLKPDRVLIGHCHPRLFLAALPFGKYSTIAHGNDFLAAQYRWHRPMFNALLRRSAPLIANSGPIARKLEQIGISGAVVISPGVDPERFFPARKKNKIGRTLLSVGRLVPRKGMDTVLQSLPAVLDEIGDVEYWIAGDGPDRARLEQLTRALGLSSSVHFLGRVSDRELPAVYREADVFILPVREERGSIEGFGIVFLEAGASGLPVISGRSGGAHQAVEEGVTGILVDPDDPDQLARTISDLLGDEEGRFRMGAAGRRRVEEEMNWDRTARQLIKALH